MDYKQKIEFMFDYNCSPLWLTRDYDKNVAGCWFVSAEGYFIGDDYSLNGEPLDIRELEKSLKIPFLFCVGCFGHWRFHQQ